MAYATKMYKVVKATMAFASRLAFYASGMPLMLAHMWTPR